MSKLQFSLQWQQGHARAGTITLNGVSIKTPCFMPVGTKATIKGIILDMLRDPQYIGEHLEPINLILANTFHLYLRPGADVVKGAGWLHSFERRPGLILTDSGGFQAFSLGSWNTLKKTDGGARTNPALAKLLDHGVKFRSPHDGSAHLFTPQNVVDTQIALGSDIMMMLDVCSPAWITRKKYERQMWTTHRRAKEAFEYYQPLYEQNKWILVPIVQGWLYEDLRLQSIEALSPFATDMIAVGGVSVGEAKEDIHRIMEFVGPKLPIQKPRYIMGIGTPEDITQAVRSGFDMFDCVLATRLGRHGTVFGPSGTIKLKNANYKSDHTPLNPDVDRFPAKFTKAYLHHLVRENEMLAGSLLSLYNILYLHHLCQQLRKEIVGV